MQFLLTYFHILLIAGVGRSCSHILGGSGPVLLSDRCYHDKNFDARHTIRITKMVVIFW